jgi:V/A-type H+-transporting ATPase subunit C
LVRAGDLESCIFLLRETRFAGIEEVYRNTGDLAMVELALFGREVALHLEVERHTEGPVRDFAAALTARYEKDVLKHALRLWFDRVVRGRDVAASTSYLYREPIHEELPLDRLIGARTIDEVVDLLRPTTYGDAVREGAGSVAEGSLFGVEMALDRFYYRRLLQAASRLDSRDRQIADRMIGIEVDLENASWIVRLRSAYGMPAERIVGYLIPTSGGPKAADIEAALSAGNTRDLLGRLLGKRLDAAEIVGGGGPGRSDERSRLLLVEGLLEQILRREVHRILGGYPFTVGIILAYSLLERREMSTIVTILNAKLYGLDPERVRNML